MGEAVNQKRMELVMRCYDKLPVHLRDWVSGLSFSLRDDHILRGASEVEQCKAYIESGGQPDFRIGNGQN